MGLEIAHKGTLIRSFLGLNLSCETLWSAKYILYTYVNLQTNTVKPFVVNIETRSNNLQWCAMVGQSFNTLMIRPDTALAVRDKQLFLHCVA